MSAKPVQPLGVYVHWPYCARICPYCDFNVYKNRTINADDWRNAFPAELQYWGAKITQRPLRSLYFGGGTPSLAPVEVIETVIDTCATIWGFEENAEITLEANPTSAEENAFADYKKAGVNRLSLGVQSLEDAALKFLGRDHSAAEALTALERALTLFPTSSFDLIYALPDQTLRGWEKELNSAITLGAAHLSLYQLTIEPGTAFEKAIHRGAWQPPEENLTADMFDATQAITRSANLPAYEISNHAAEEAQARHNLLYWRQHDYIGIGPGAHGRLNINKERLATENIHIPEDYLKAVSTKGVGLTLSEPLTLEAQFTERLSMGLRLIEGCHIDKELAIYLERKKEKLSTLTNEELIEIGSDRITTTSAGRRVLNTILSYLLT